MGARGIQIFTNVNGRPLDDPEFAPIFEMMHSYDLPIWMHPTRPAKFADYPTENQSKFDIWWVFGWPYETSAAMARMVFSGFFDKCGADLKIITHHLGAMVPFLEARVGLGLRPARLARGGGATLQADHHRHERRRNRRPVDYFKMFFADTAINGSKSGTPMRHRLLRLRARAVRHRLPVRSRGRPAVHPRDHQDAGRARPRCRSAQD